MFLTAERQSPYKVTTDSYEKIKDTGDEWTAEPIIQKRQLSG
jgi:hypothetical protein